MDVIKLVGKYLNLSVGPLCYNTDKVLTTVLDKENVEGFASIILRLASKSGVNLSQEQILLSYQWLEHIAMYSNQATFNPVFAKNFLQGINRALEKKTYLTGNHLTITDVAVFYVVHPLVGHLSVSEQESLLHLCRWCKHIQVQPKQVSSIPPWYKIPLPKQLFPHDLNNVSLDKPVVYHPQPFSYPGYPVILYL